MNDKKYQVFISSTYADLVEERKHILDVLFMADCIPAGMEAFVAADLEQFEVIKKVIDLCDYYVLIIGKRYGSIHPETGLSYTEMEYDYAIKNNIPVLVFAIDESIDLSPDKMESEEDKIEKLKKFRTKAMANRLASIWKSTDDLTGKLAVAIMKAKSEIKRPGWQRAVDFDEASLRREIMDLKSQNEKLIDELRDANKKINSLTEQNDVAFENKEIDLKCYYYINHCKRYTIVSCTLVKIFLVIATEMMDVSLSESTIENTIKEAFFSGEHSVYFEDKQLIKKLLNQYRVLGLIRSIWKEEVKKLFWGLTTKGNKVRDDYILLK